VKEVGRDNQPRPVHAGPRPGRLEAKNITADNPANDTNPVYSRDGQQMVFLAAADQALQRRPGDAHDPRAQRLHART